MRPLFLLILFTSLIGCKPERLPEDQVKDLLFNFNKRSATSYFQNYINSEDFKFMTKRDKCVLDKFISSHLDYGNDWNLTVVDSFYVRSYYDWDFLHQITFVATEKGKFYFLYIPEFQEIYRGDNHYNEDDLKDSIGNAIIKFNIPMINTFVNGEIHKIKNFKQQVDQLDHLFTFVLKDLFFERVTDYELIESIKGRSKQQEEEIIKEITPIIDHKSFLIQSEDHRVYKSSLGFSLVHFKKDRANSSNVNLEIYFVPFVKRPKYVSHGDPMFRDCYK